jgi:hypothetical protein
MSVSYIPQLGFWATIVVLWGALDTSETKNVKSNTGLIASSTTIHKICMAENRSHHFPP